MTAPTRRSASREVRRVSVDVGGPPLSGLLAEPEHGPVRAAVLALHGSGMNAGYFDTRTRPGLSLLALGPSLGYTVLALDRPGYGLSAARLPQGQRVADQAVAVRAALRYLADRGETGAGILLLAHSFGGKVALAAAGDLDGESLLGLDLSGIGHAYEAEVGDQPDPLRHGGWRRNWGPLRLYPPGTFRQGGAPVETVPPMERAELARWPGYFHDLAPRVRVPVRLTFAEHEAWWRHDPAALGELTAAFTGAPRVTVEHQAEAGHNISLGLTARSYHLRALGFLEDCLVAREARTVTST